MLAISNHLSIEVLRRPVEPGQYTAIRYSNRLTDAGAVASIGRVGDSYDNAMAESVIGLYKTEAIRAGSPFRTGPFHTVADLEAATSAWVHWYNNHRLMHRLGRIPPAEYEADHYARIGDGQEASPT